MSPELARQPWARLHVRKAPVDANPECRQKLRRRSGRARTALRFFSRTGTGGSRDENCDRAHARRSGGDGAAAHFSRYRHSRAFGHSSADCLRGAGRQRVWRGGAAAAGLSARCVAGISARAGPELARGFVESGYCLPAQSRAPSAAADDRRRIWRGRDRTHGRAGGNRARRRGAVVSRSRGATSPAKLPSAQLRIRQQADSIQRASRLNASDCRLGDRCWRFLWRHSVGWYAHGWKRMRPI